MLLLTDVTRYLEFKAVEGSYVQASGKVEKVPSTSKEAFSSPLMGLLEKNRCRKFFNYLGQYKQEDPKTHEGLDLTKVPMSAVFKKFGLKPDTIDFLGHALALYREVRLFNGIASICCCDCEFQHIFFPHPQFRTLIWNCQQNQLLIEWSFMPTPWRGTVESLLTSTLCMALANFPKVPVHYVQLQNCLVNSL